MAQEFEAGRLRQHNVRKVIGYRLWAIGFFVIGGFELLDKC
jgi:hypothetical protein